MKIKPTNPWTYASVVILILCMQAFAAWAITSLAVSTVKTVTDSCEVTYVIDDYIKTDLFCPPKR